MRGSGTSTPRYGFRTVSGEGGRPFGLDKYGKALYVAWRYKHRAALGEANATLKDLGGSRGNHRSLCRAHLAGDEQAVAGLSLLRGGVPMAQAAGSRRRQQGDRCSRAAGCEEIQKYLVTWPSWLFARGDVAAGGAGDESPLEFSDRTLKVEETHRFTFVRGGRGVAAEPRRRRDPRRFI